MLKKIPLWQTEACKSKSTKDHSTYSNNPVFKNCEEFSGSVAVPEGKINSVNDYFGVVCWKKAAYYRLEFKISYIS